MYRPRHQLKAASRQGVILLVVIALLTLFAIVGIAFVYYSSSEATSSRVFRESVFPQVQPDESPDALFRWFFGQLIYDTDDNTGTNSVMRGHSLARTMYGWDYDGTNSPPDPNTAASGATAGTNINPFNGVGRLYYKDPAFFNVENYNLPNYTYYTGDQLRDPERIGTRPPPAIPTDPAYKAALTTPYVGCNASYTYPDVNNMYLAAVRADGTVLVPSYFRYTTGFGSLDPSNPNWKAAGGQLKYMVMRPRPAENPLFPVSSGINPQDGGGDVKNLLGSPGTLNPSGGPNFNNDSIWIDAGYPVKQTPDGRLYKPLFAALVMDLDNRVNINAIGNVRGQTSTHLSNQGWGKWEINLGTVLGAGGGTEWANLFTASNLTAQGRYGPDMKPAKAGAPSVPPAPWGPQPHFYAPADYDASNDGAGPVATTALALPSGFNCFPSFPAGYGNGSVASNELKDHPRAYDYFAPQGDDTSFNVANMKKLLYHMGSDALSSDMGLLCPKNFDPSDPTGQTQRRCYLVTTVSYDVDRPGVTPWVWDPTATPYTLAAGQPAPTGGPIAFPPVGLAGTASALSEFNNEWRAADAVLGRVDLDRDLTPYPAAAADGIIDLTKPSVLAPRFPTNKEQYNYAVWDRQQLAADIFLRLVKVTGAYDPTIAPVAPTQGQLDALRWLAQLSANMVDYIDSDNYMTPFNWAGNSPNQNYKPNAMGMLAPAVAKWDTIGNGWVFGTEMPRLVINEAYAEIANTAGDPLDPVTKAAKLPYNFNFWVELHNPVQADPADPDNGNVNLQLPANGPMNPNPPYQLVVHIPPAVPPPGGPYLSRADNVFGDPDPTGQKVLDVTDYTQEPAPTVQSKAKDVHIVQPGGIPPPPGGPVGDNVGFYVLGPKDDFPGTAPPNTNFATLRVKSNGALNAMSYKDPSGMNNDRDLTKPLPTHTILLRRLACPNLPLDPVQGSPTYNPYVTVDYIENVQTNDAVANTGGPAGGLNPSPPLIQVTNRVSYGKLAPFASYNDPPPKDSDPANPNDQVLPQTSAPANQPKHSFFLHNTPRTNPFDWLVHLDRQPISPMEMLQVSAFKPHELTQKFVSKGKPFGQRAPWFDPNSRLYRVFEFLETHDHAAGVSMGGRTPGKININTMNDPETLYALCDPQAGNINAFDPNGVNNIFKTLTSQRTADPNMIPGNPNMIPGNGDRPFLGLAAPFTTAGPGTQYPAGSDLDSMFLRSFDGTDTPLAPRLFGAAIAPPPTDLYLQSELMTKIFNHITTRSNVFAVWLTVGFFDVTDNSVTPPQLGGEIGFSQNKNIRHRMFAIVDRSNLALIGPNLTPYLTTFISSTYDQVANATTVTVGATNGSGASNNIQWQISPGSYVVVDSGGNQETVMVSQQSPSTVTATSFQFQGQFLRNHAKNSPVTIPGNPGPQPLFDPSNAAYSPLVPYYVILQ